jgi:adenine-specific DNA-methyltransferase
MKTGTKTRSGLLQAADILRLEANRHLEPERRSELGQFMTPEPVARLMAGMVEGGETVRLLEAGAGIGSLFAAAVEQLCDRKKKPSSITVTAFEIDESLASYIPQTFGMCRDECNAVGVAFAGEVKCEDFIAWAAEMLSSGLFSTRGRPSFTTAILNPPYRKINSNGPERRMLREVGIETSNLYTAFLALVVMLLEPGGELVAITPRSFCNGPYFKPFREILLSQTSITHAHVFDCRKTAFKGDDVLQENIIFRAVKRVGLTGKVTISTSRASDDPDIVVREVDASAVISPDDPDRVIHIVQSELQSEVAHRVRSFQASLPDLGIQVSTGRVVDFRAKDALVQGLQVPKVKHAPLIYPGHFDAGSISWPRDGKKPNYLLVDKTTQSLLVPSGTYVLVKRFSSKEEKRRISAAVCSPSMLDADNYAFENHLNYYHDNGAGMNTALAYGLAIYLNSGLVDAYFRQFSGHTQVNASDLRGLPYPAREVLERLGKEAGLTVPGQDEIDDLLNGELSDVATSIDPLKARRKIDEAMAVLNLLGVPRAQQNDRSALTLLALLDLKPSDGWEDASSPLMGITPIMDFARDNYGTTYAPNTRETFRRQTMHQFCEAAIALYNPDKPDRPVNSPKAAYQVAPLLLDTLRTFGTPEWTAAMAEWLGQVQTLKVRYAKEREMSKIPLKLPTGQQIELSPGGQNVLVEKIIHEFCPRFLPDGLPLYVGDTEEKYAFFDKAGLKALGVEVDSHGKMPDVVVHYVEKNWLVLIEAVTSHGPVDGKRHDELARLFGKSTAPLVYVTTFMDRTAMVRFLSEIAWETEVWVADAPSHMIHFNGVRFLGPYLPE